MIQSPVPLMTAPVEGAANLRREEVVATFRVSLREVDRAIASGRLRSRKIGRSRVIDAASARAAFGAA